MRGADRLVSACLSTRRRSQGYRALDQPSRGGGCGRPQGPSHELLYYWATPGSPWHSTIIAGSETTYSAPAIAVRSTSPAGKADVVAQGPNHQLLYYWPRQAPPGTPPRLLDLARPIQPRRLPYAPPGRQMWSSRGQTMNYDTIGPRQAPPGTPPRLLDLARPIQPRRLPYAPPGRQMWSSRAKP